jgi:hypothetical protein
MSSSLPYIFEKNIKNDMTNDPSSYFDDLSMSATGFYFYLEEIMMQEAEKNILYTDNDDNTNNYNKTSFVRPNVQVGRVNMYTEDDINHVVDVTNMREEVLKLDGMCLFFQRIGLVEFIDFGVNPVPSFRNQYIHQPAPRDVCASIYMFNLYQCMLYNNLLL